MLDWTNSSCASPFETTYSMFKPNTLSLHDAKFTLSGGLVDSNPFDGHFAVSSNVNPLTPAQGYAIRRVINGRISYVAWILELLTATQQSTIFNPLLAPFLQTIYSHMAVQHELSLLRTPTTLTHNTSLSCGPGKSAHLWGQLSIQYPLQQRSSANFSYGKSAWPLRSRRVAARRSSHACGRCTL